MMGATRRQFLSGAAAATAGVALINRSGEARERALLGEKNDEIVASKFFSWPGYQKGIPTPKLVALVYGMVCVDLSGKEALLPNVKDVPNVSEHNARIWVHQDYLESTTGSPTGGTGVDTKMLYYSIAGKVVTFKALDASKNPLPDAVSTFRKRNRSQQPWANFKWVRCLKQTTGLSLIDDASRNKPELVSARVKLRIGTVAALPPFGPDGQFGEWKVTHPNGKVDVASTTDSMVWGCPLASNAKFVEISIDPIAGGAGSKVTLKLIDNTKYGTSSALFALTHNTDEDHDNATMLHDTTAFARLLVGNDPSKFPVPELEVNEYPRIGKSSASDVHCECASCP